MSRVNRRRHPRSTGKGVIVQLETGAEITPCVVENISQGGALVRTSSLVPRGTKVALRLARPGMKNFLRVEGRVVTATDSSRLTGLGIQLAPLRPADAVRYEELLAGLDTAVTNPEEPTALVPVKDGILRAQIDALQKELAEAWARFEDKDRQLTRFRAELDRLRLELRKKDELLMRRSARDE